jgi:hypothetical protein
MGSEEQSNEPHALNPASNKVHNALFSHSPCNCQEKKNKRENLKKNNIDRIPVETKYTDLHEYTLNITLSNLCIYTSDFGNLNFLSQLLGFVCVVQSVMVCVCAG